MLIRYFSTNIVYLLKVCNSLRLGHKLTIPYHGIGLSSRNEFFNESFRTICKIGAVESEIAYVNNLTNPRHECFLLFKSMSAWGSFKPVLGLNDYIYLPSKHRENSSSHVAEVIKIIKA